MLRRETSKERSLYAILGWLVVALWLPCLQGSIDLSWDGGVYNVFGTSLAEGKGCRLLNEPGEIQANQYPPLFPLIVAAHQLVFEASASLVMDAYCDLAVWTGARQTCRSTDAERLRPLDENERGG